MENENMEPTIHSDDEDSIVTTVMEDRDDKESMVSIVTEEREKEPENVTAPIYKNYEKNKPLVNTAKQSNYFLINYLT